MSVRLSELVRSLGGACDGAADPEITGVRADSRRVEAGELFAALPGLVHDGSAFARDALARGARAVLAPAPLPLAGPSAPVWVHADARRVAGRAAALVHASPARSLLVVAVTGTNGKSTVAHFAAEILARAGRRPGVVGTLGVRLHGSEPEHAAHTTPEATELQRIAARQRDLGGDALVLEASSHALDQERLAGLDVDVAVWTNLSRDHLDYHGSMEAYAAAKERLFEHLRPGGAAAVHAGGPYARRAVLAARRSGACVVTYGTGSRADLRATRVVVRQGGTLLELEGMGIQRTEVHVPLVGRHDVENALAAAAAALLAEASPSRVLEGLAAVSPPRGRLERCDTGGRGLDVFVDYAHSPDALERVLGSLRELRDASGGDGRILCVFGCGGERDRGKRAPMGALAARLADRVYVTSDNPRSEDPEAIAAEVLAGAREAMGGAELHLEVDRRAAIRRAIADSRPGDLVLVAGKGHETWQYSNGQKLPFDDRRVVEEELA